MNTAKFPYTTNHDFGYQNVIRYCFTDRANTTKPLSLLFQYRN